MAVIFHLDLDAFFVSVERILDPSLNNKPVIVGGNPQGRGVVAACSYEARAFGIHSAMPVRNAYRLCPHAVFLHGHGDEYSRYSRLVKNILIRYAPVIQQASVDEFYMDMTGCTRIYGSLYGFAARLQQEIWNELSLPCSIGIAGNKTVAKICSDFHKPRGITYVMPGMEKEFLAPLPVQVIPGVGGVMQRALNSKGIYRICDITRLPEEYFSAAFGKYGTELWHHAHGKGTEFLATDRERKSISRETTFREDVISMQKIKSTLFELTADVCQSLRDHEWLAGTITLKLRYSDFETITRSRTIKPDDDDAVVFSVAESLLDKSYTRRVAVRLIGVGLSNFVLYPAQELLFPDAKTSRKRLFRAVNTLRSKFGYNTVRFGSV